MPKLTDPLEDGGAVGPSVTGFDARLDADVRRTHEVVIAWLNRTEGISSGDAYALGLTVSRLTVTFQYLRESARLGEDTARAMLDAMTDAAQPALARLQDLGAPDPVVASVLRLVTSTLPQDPGG